MKSSAKASPGSGKAKGQSFYDKTRRNAVTKQMQQNYSKGKG